MPTVTPYIPTNITVHLGLPDSDAPNVTVPFKEYIYNVASSEIYPTWDESALRANILAIISYALNRVYTEYYPSRGYNFNITSSTAYDQKFINGRNYFENIVQIVDEIFNNYIRRVGNIEPLSASFCNGTTVTCPGMSQWGSQALAEQGYNSVEILKHYYGDDIELVVNAPIQDFQYSYPGTALRVGSSGPAVVVIQASLNQIAQHYPAIPTVVADGIFGPATENSVRVFQRVFNLAVDGIVGKATWYKLVQLYVAIRQLNELTSQGQKFSQISWAYPDALTQGNSGVNISHLQYMLSVIAEFEPEIPGVEVSGYFNEATTNAVRAFQQFAGLPVTGTVDKATWDALYERFAGIENTVLDPSEYLPPLTSFPGTTLQSGMRD